MKTLILYSSFFGNTKKIAEAVREVINKDTKMVDVGTIKKEDLVGINLLIVGSPTRAFRPTPQLVDFLKSLPAGSLTNVRAAVFDTRIDPVTIKKPGLRNFLTLMIKLFGYADQPLAKILQNKGANVLGTAGFVVKDTEGPLLEGEKDRAKDWIKRLADGGKNG